ncbi:hypothetical protein OG352_19235 [Streptomyces sp. NBC_01485]|uniref:zinc ribbon domain-containing protein n=1 Tax=Streptomyces sp. NBC_01485 TaxID=2903884 RepID=UPI002E377573|nr:hypothetical protein [Streptomyces sp. NBC_01485]
MDQAVAAGASVIYVEDLRSMEARGMGRTMNTRLSQAVRGQITDRMRHLAAEAGIAVVIVPPKNTSRHCPQCLTPLRHRKAPDHPTTPGWKWAPSPAGPTGPAGKRPEGHAPTDRTRLPRAAHRHQDVTTIDTPATAGHRPLGAALGAGFHLHAHATPPRRESLLPDTTARLERLSRSETLMLFGPGTRRPPVVPQGWELPWSGA